VTLLKVFPAITLILALIAGQNAKAAGLNGNIEISGTVMGKGAPCVQFRMSSGETISLQGASPLEYKKGDTFKLTGAWLRISSCMQGRAFRVSRRIKI
jgi:hypothetical protein